MKYDRTVIAYHGCDAETAERLLHGEPFKKSQNAVRGSTSGSTAPTERSNSRTTSSAAER